MHRERGRQRNVYVEKRAFSYLNTILHTLHHSKTTVPIYMCEVRVPFVIPQRDC